MPNTPLRGDSAPVTYIDSLNDVTVAGNRAILSFDSIGANVRLTISENTLRRLMPQLQRAAVEIGENRDACTVLAFKQMESGQ